MPNPRRSLGSISTQHRPKFPRGEVTKMNLVQPRQTRSFVALLSSVFCSAAAVALITTVLGKQVYDLTGSALDLGLLGLAEFAPAALLVFLTGTLADRVDRRRLACAGLAVQAMTIAALA